MGTKFHSKINGHRTVQISSEFNDFNVSGVGERIIFHIRFPLPRLWNLNSAYLSVDNE